MTRWARRSGAASGRALDATPWAEMAAGPEVREGRTGPLSVKKEPEKRKKKNKKKKEYLSEDVNGFAAHLRESSERGEAGGAAPREEMAAALRKERRREDRRLKRQEMKKNAMVCFHCREPGHGVADCPAVLKSQDMGTGICYRCGSTEHDISKCKAKVDPAVGAFPYAKCFICGEMGHLSRSCPDNPKGLYAEGGGCRLCGSVEHFRKDCPEKQNAEMESCPSSDTYGEIYLKRVGKQQYATVLEGKLHSSKAKASKELTCPLKKSVLMVSTLPWREDRRSTR